MTTPRNIYVKEDVITPGLAFLNEKFNDDLDQTAETLAGHDEPEPELKQRQAAIRDQIRDYDRRLARHLTALDHADGEIDAITKWIADVERDRKSLQAQLGGVVPGGTLTKSQMRALVAALRDNELYQQLGVNLTQYPDGRVAVEALPRRVQVRVGAHESAHWRPTVSLDSRTRCVASEG